MWTREVCINYISCTELWYHSHIFIQNWNKVAPCSKVHQIPFGVLEFYCTCLYSEIFSSWNWRELLLSRIGGCQGERYASITFFCIELWYHLHILIQNWSKVAQFSKVCHRFPVAWYLNFTAFVCSNRFLVVEVQQLTWVTYFYLEYEAVKQKGMHYIFLHKLWYHYHLHIFIQSWSRGAISSKVCHRFWHGTKLLHLPEAINFWLELLLFIQNC